jgi:hypothetical protein
MRAPMFSGLPVFLPVADGRLRPLEGGCILEVEFRPRLLFVLVLLGVSIVPGVLDRSAWFIGPVFALLGVLMASIYVVVPEVDALKRDLVKALPGPVEQLTP